MAEGLSLSKETHREIILLHLNSVPFKSITSHSTEKLELNADIILKVLSLSLLNLHP